LNGAYTLTGTAILSTPTIVVGLRARSIQQSGGSTTTGTRSRWRRRRRNGTYNLSAGRSRQQVNVGYRGLGCLQTGARWSSWRSPGGQLILALRLQRRLLERRSLLVGDLFVGSSGARSECGGTGTLTVDNASVHDNLTADQLEGGTINAKALNLKALNLNWTGGTSIFRATSWTRRLA
jgi:hypothetical protein